VASLIGLAGFEINPFAYWLKEHLVNISLAVLNIKESQLQSPITTNARGGRAKIKRMIERAL